MPRLASKTFGWVSRQVALVSTSPSAPAASAVRTSVPRLPAYSIPSATSTSRPSGRSRRATPAAGPPTTARVPSGRGGAGRGCARRSGSAAVRAAANRAAVASRAGGARSPGHHSTTSTAAPLREHDLVRPATGDRGDVVGARQQVAPRAGVAAYVVVRRPGMRAAGPAPTGRRRPPRRGTRTGGAWAWRAPTSRSDVLTSRRCHGGGRQAAGRRLVEVTPRYPCRRRYDGRRRPHPNYSALRAGRARGGRAAAARRPRGARPAGCRPAAAGRARGRGGPWAGRWWT